MPFVSTESVLEGPLASISLRVQRPPQPTPKHAIRSGFKTDFDTTAVNSLLLLPPSRSPPLIPLYLPLGH